MFEATRKLLDLAKNQLYLNPDEVEGAIFELELAEAQIEHQVKSGKPGPANIEQFTLIRNRRGVKTRRQKAPTSRFGEGKVHLLVFSKEYESWYRVCENTNHLDPYGDNRPDEEPITCKLCLRSGLV